MSDKKRYVNQGSPEGAKLLLKQLVRKQVTAVYKTALETVEIRFGDQFDGFEQLRKKILDTGNAAIRKLEERIESDYEVSIIKNVVTFTNKRDGVEDDG